MAQQTRIILIRHGASHHKDDGVVGGPWMSWAHERRATAGRGAGPTTQPGASRASICRLLLGAAARRRDSRDSGGGPGRASRRAGLQPLYLAHPPAADGMPWSEYRPDEQSGRRRCYRPFERGNESWSETVGRSGRALEQIAARHAGQTVLSVAHAETVVSSLIVFGCLPLMLAFDVMVAPASITEWVTEGDPEAWPRPRWTLVRLNDSGHRSGR